MAEVRLRSGREKSLLRRHPWIFSGAIQQVLGSPQDGETVLVADADGGFLAWGAYSSHSQIRLRVWSWDSQDVIDAQFLRQRLQRCIQARRSLDLARQTDAVRLVHGESDGLPGLVVDQYADFLVMQCLSSGPERWKAVLADLLLELTQAHGIYERSDADVRQLEGLTRQVGLLRGVEPPEHLEIHENGMRFSVDVRGGHKTGYYLDQRASRARLRMLCSGKDVLDCFSYTGGFAVSCLAGGANHITLVDSSAKALALAQHNLDLNGLSRERADFVEADVFRFLREQRDRGRNFDCIILDPPKFAPTAAQAERAARGYKDINLLAFKLLRPGGILATFSCSGGIDAALFQKIVAGAALDAGVDALILEHLHQAPDHPVALNFPEGAYLKGLVLEVR